MDLDYTFVSTTHRKSKHLGANCGINWYIEWWISFFKVSLLLGTKNDLEKASAVTKIQNQL
jgi:hypothetical protein